MAGSLNVQLQCEDLEVGETLHGVMTWVPEKDGSVKGITMSFGWRTEGRGDTTSGRVSTTALAGGPVKAGQAVRCPFALPVPVLAPPTYDGNILRIIWELNIAIDIPWATDARTSVPVLVLSYGTRARQAAVASPA